MSCLRQKVIFILRTPFLDRVRICCSVFVQRILLAYHIYSSMLFLLEGLNVLKGLLVVLFVFVVAVWIVGSLGCLFRCC